MLVYYIGVSSASILIVKFTESGGGKLDYNVTTAVLGAELTKLLLAAILDKFWFDTPSAQVDTSGKSTTWKNYTLYAVPALIYSVQNNLLIYGISLLGPSLFSLFSNLKIVTTTLLTSLILGRNFTKIQWIGVVMLVLSFFVAKVDLLMGDTAGNCKVPGHRLLTEAAVTAEAEAAALAARFLQGIVVIVILAMLSGSAAISNEYLLKNMDADVSFMRKNMWTYEWGAALNLVFLVFTYFKYLLSDGEIPGLFAGYSPAVLLLILINAMLGLSVSMIMKYFDNVAKCFAGSFVVYFTAAFSYFYFNASTVNGPFSVAVVIFTISTFLYMGSHNDDLPKVNLSGSSILAAFGFNTKQLYQAVAVKPEDTKDENEATVVGKTKTEAS